MSEAERAGGKGFDSGALCTANLRMDGFAALKAEIVGVSDGQPIPGLTRDEGIPATVRAQSTCGR